jgi:hypothetical protein
MMTRAEMIEILESIARDEDVNATAKCTAIRTLNELAPDTHTGAFDDLDELAPRRRRLKPSLLD